MTQKIPRHLFFLYHVVFYSKNPTCRFQPTCSAYTLEAIKKYGAFKGLWLATKRVLSCHPFSNRPIYDPVAP